MKQIRTKQRASCLFEQHAGFPTMRHMRRVRKTETMATGAENFVVIHAFSGAKSKIVNTHQCANHAANWLCGRRNLQPLIKRAALVRLEMTEAKPTNGCGIYDSPNLFKHCWKQHSHPGMKQQRFFI